MIHGIIDSWASVGNLANLKSSCSCQHFWTYIWVVNNVYESISNVIMWYHSRWWFWITVAYFLADTLFPLLTYILLLLLFVIPTLFAFLFPTARLSKLETLFHYIIIKNSKDWSYVLTFGRVLKMKAFFSEFNIIERHFLDIVIWQQFFLSYGLWFSLSPWPG